MRLQTEHTGKRADQKQQSQWQMNFSKFSSNLIRRLNLNTTSSTLALQGKGKQITL